MAAPSHPVKPGSSIASVKAQIRAFVESTADAEGYVHYLAYGSNMNSKVLSGRRKVFPVASKPCKCPGWVMRYASRGACYMEPAFGVIIPRPDNAPASEPDCHGVAHRITVDEFLQIVATEGGGGHPELGYSIVDVAVETTVEPKETIERVLTLGAGTKVRFDLLCSLR